jgi:hypothetical protein
MSEENDLIIVFATIRKFFNYFSYKKFLIIFGGIWGVFSSGIWT